MKLRRWLAAAAILGIASLALAGSTEEVSKINGYAVLQNVGEGLSKSNGYAVLCCSGPGMSKLNGYAVLQPAAGGGGARPQVWITQ